MAAQAPPSTTPTSVLSEEMLRIIRGEDPVDKAAAYDTSLQRWWTEYAARKNDEDQEHVADSLLYDERCHLPRTVPPPVFNTTPNGTQEAPQNGTHPKPQQ